MELLQTTLCYLEKDGAYLMLHRVKKKNDVNHDKWVGVGGKFEPGEDAPACALREVREETGLTMHAPPPVSTALPWPPRSRSPALRASAPSYTACSASPWA